MKKKFKFIPDFGTQFWMVDIFDRIEVIEKTHDIHFDPIFAVRIGNCFRTKRQAEAMAMKIRKLLKTGLEGVLIGAK